MEGEEDLVVLLVVGDEKSKYSLPEVKHEIKYDSANSLDVKDIMEIAKKYGESVKIEPEGEDSSSNVEEELEQDIKLEFSDADDPPEEIDNSQTDEVYVPVIDESNEQKKSNLNKNTQKYKSLVEELRQQYTELREDEELLINTLEEIMLSVKHPETPEEFFKQNSMMYDCVLCDAISETIPAANKHFREKHGVRYLLCYACGKDFRSTTNLYKHEKRCKAPDAFLVIKARAACLGRRGRGRPLPKTFRVTKFPCEECSAVFTSRLSLEAHINLHRGERPFRCHMCPAAYLSYTALCRHTKKHTDVQFICDHCSKSFKIKAALVSHMDTHRSLPKFGCSECSRRFAHKQALTLHHHKVHLKLPPQCACQICPRRFSRMYELNGHMKKAHGMSIITRKMFFRSLPTMSESEVKQSTVIL